jgi:hypothetical protein
MRAPGPGIARPSRRERTMPWAQLLKQAKGTSRRQVTQ